MEMKTHSELSKFLSFVLRHRPESIGVELDKAGWTDISVLLTQCNANGKAITREVLEEIVASDSKGRYSISEDGLKIRANQGHSVKVDLGYRQKKPPVVLYHGTVETALDSIMKKGLDKMKRHHVHLSENEDTAKAVGSRRGKAVVLKIAAAEMDRAGFEFFLSDNGVWLTDNVPSKFISK